MADVFHFGDIRVDLGRFQIERAGQPVAIEPKAVDLLVLLAGRAGDLVTKREILDALWPDAIVTENALTRLVAHLRKAIGDDATTPKYIATVPTRGYRFVATVERDDTPVAPPVIVVDAVKAGDAVADAALVPLQQTTSRARWSLPAVIAVCSALALVAVSTALARPWTWLRPPAGARIRALAVLPLQNLSGDAEQEYFADGLTDQLITDLAQSAELRVISRTSVMHYKGTTKVTPDIARELRVDAIIEGSIVRSGSRVRVTVQLIDGATDHHLWAQSYDRDLGDSLALQSEVTRAIANEVQLALTPEHLRVLSSAPRLDPAVQEAYLRGRALLQQGGEPQIRKAMEWFNAALAKRPQDARSWAGLADCYIALADFYEPSRDVMPKARDAAARALAIDETLSAAHVTAGVVHFLFDWDWAGADTELRRAIALQPGSSEAHGWRSVLLAQLGRFDEAVREMESAESLDPVSSVVHQNAAWVYYLARQEDRAIEEWHKSLEIDPGFQAVHATIWLGYLRGAPLAKVLGQVDAAAGGAQNLSDLATMAGIYATAGRRREAETILSRIEADASTRYVCPYELATARAALGQKDAAMSYLRKGIADRSTCMPDAKTDPRLDSLRSDPRFQELLRALAFPR